MVGDQFVIRVCAVAVKQQLISANGEDVVLENLFSSGAKETTPGMVNQTREFTIYRCPINETQMLLTDQTPISQMKHSPLLTLCGCSLFLF